MRIAFALPNLGRMATPDAIRQVAQRAEQLGYSSLWTIDRLLYPVKPRTPYPATPDGSLPGFYKHVLDPLDALTYAAAFTSKIGLGTSVLDIPFYNPVVLARRLASIDQLSSGRLRVGFGLGWSADEMEAANADMKKRGAMANEFLEVLKTMWGADPVEYHGKFYNVPASYVSLKPVQKPHPPIYMAAFAPAALERIARHADGWNPVGIPVGGMAQMFAAIKDMAQRAGRDPSRLQMIVRANLEITSQPLGAERPIFCGTLDQIHSDLRQCREIGADEVICQPTDAESGNALAAWLKLMEELKNLLESEAA